MHYSSELGNENAYVVLFVVVHFVLDNVLGRMLITMWAVGFYAGNVMKDWLELPRPSAPPVVRMETTYENEHGLPSSHAWNAMALSLFLASRVATTAAFAAAAAYTGLISVSRLYLGVHSGADVLAGLVLGAAHACAWRAAGDAVDAAAAAAPYVVPLLALLLLRAYPNRARSNPAYEDVSVALGTACGFLVSNAAFRLRIRLDAHTPATAAALLGVALATLACLRPLLKRALLWLLRPPDIDDDETTAAVVMIDVDALERLERGDDDERHATRAQPKKPPCWRYTAYKFLSYFLMCLLGVALTVLLVNGTRGRLFPADFSIQLDFHANVTAAALAAAPPPPHPPLVQGFA